MRRVDGKSKKTAIAQPMTIENKGVDLVSNDAPLDRQVVCQEADLLQQIDGSSLIMFTENCRGLVRQGPLEHDLRDTRELQLTELGLLILPTGAGQSTHERL